MPDHPGRLNNVQFLRRVRRTDSTIREGQPETTTLAFEAEFDGLRRQPVPTEETLLDPSRYWDLAGGGTD
ncbi:hypothetical protein HQ394_03420 [Defluviicoccus vanus]|uniref:Uncharacterized protein n=1 Tax=Defluviicoccus vanus TaxID=111831 RepID=A0A7H1MYQ5_9PROT|nr:hypothetical protein HQ394_03420 [Defluviicoccus vanus]